MGIPKFFRWISERYPCLTQEIKEYQIPQFDNLYLDMNGIIHICSHPNDNDPHFRITEEQIFRDIFHYIEVLFRLIQPKKVFFMAVDGVAPRAKMNQQRGRRFSSAKAAETMEKKAVERGETLPSEARFDSNCITPGTEFMAKLQEQLKYFVTKKISTDKTWRRPTVILSGHSVPGEGEHKIMDYIRYLKSQPDWDPTTRHCLYGLDADLIILGLSTHEPNFSLLREEVKYVKSNQHRLSTPETTNYVLFHLSLLRDYLDLEFKELEDNLPFPYDIDSIIDDWILMGFLVGNDFIPHLPHLHIANNALSLLYDTYKKIMPTLDGYINENGILNLVRLEKFVIALSQFDRDHFEETYADMKYFEAKTGRSMRTDFATATNSNDKSKTADPELRALIAASEMELFDFGEDTVGEALEEEGLETIRQYEGEEGGGMSSQIIADDDDGDSTFDKEFTLHKRDYYINKMEYPSVDKETLRKEAEGYVRALQWILHYYYQGCPSWGWFYPHHYSPYISDLRGFAGLDIDFDPGTPFLPFQQLLAVLPAASKQLLPKGFQTLMVNEDSPILDYYPPDFRVDLNGKRQEWEAVVLIPFIEEDRLLDAMSPHYSSLTEDEKARNSHGPMQIYNYSPDSLGKYEAPEYFPPIMENHAGVRHVWPKDLMVPKDKLVVGPHPNLRPHAGAKVRYRSGFPSLTRVPMPFTSSLIKKGVRVFENVSRGENMILQIQERPELASPQNIMNEIASMSKIIYVGWPFLIPAEVSKVVFKEGVGTVRNHNNVVLERGSKEERDDYAQRLSSVRLQHSQRLGIELGNNDGIIYACPLQDYSLSFNNSNKADITMKFAPYTCCYPVSTVVFDIPDKQAVPDGFEEVTMINDHFPLNSTVFSVSRLFYGYSAKVTGHLNGWVKVCLSFTSEPDFDDIKSLVDSGRLKYMTGHFAANRLGISSYLLSRITGSIFVQSPHTDSDLTNLGFSLKFNKTNKEVVGFTKKEGSTWLYSEAVLDLVRQYIEKFPSVFEYMSMNINESIFFKDVMFPGEEGNSKLNELTAWLKSVKDTFERRTIGSVSLDQEAVSALEELLAPYEEVDLATARLRICSSFIYLPKPDVTPLCPDAKSDFQLLDRVVYVRECHDIPLGLKGVIIGIEKKENPANENDDSNYIYDIFFDKEVIGGFVPAGCKSGKKRCYRLSRHVLINISYGERAYNTRSYRYEEIIDSVSKLCEAGAPNSEVINMLTSTPVSASVSNFMKAYQNKGPEAPASKPASIIKPNGVSIVQRCRNPVPQANMRPPPHVYSGFWNSLMAGRPGIPEMQRPLNPRPQNLQPYIPPMRRLGSQSMDRPVLIPPRPMLNQAFVPPKTEPIIKETQAAPPTDFSNLITSEVNQQTEALKKILRIKSYGMPTGTMPGNPPVYPLSRLPGYEPCRNNFRNITSVPQGNDSNQVKSGTFYSNNRKPTMETSSFNNQKVSHPEEEKVNTMFVPPQVQQVEASRKATPPPPPAAPTRQAQAPPSAPTQTTKPEPRRGGRKLRIAANFNTPLNRDST